MDSSGDESFAWTEASSVQEQSPDESNKPTPNKSNMKISNGHDTETEEGFKKKLHKKLFEDQSESESEVKKELLNGSNVKHESDNTSKTRKRKRERTPTSPDSLDALAKKESTSHSNSHDEKPKPSKIKRIDDQQEPADSSQDFEVPDTPNHVTKKKKSKKKKENSNDSDNNEIIIENKLERKQSFSVHSEEETSRILSHKKETKKKKKKDRDAYDSQDDSSALENAVKKEKRDEKRRFLQTEKNMLKTDKKKKNRNHDDYDSQEDSDLVKNESGIVIEDKFEAEETIVETRPERESFNMQVDENESTVESVSKKDKKKKNKRDNNASDSQNDSSLLDVAPTNGTNDIASSQEHENDDNTTENSNQNKVNYSVADDQQPARKISLRMSERIQFEDMENVIDASVQQSSSFKRFLKENPQLDTVPYHLHNDSLITEDDDIWLLNCPQEVDILSFKDKDLTLDNKCKFKIDSQSYVGTLQNEMNRAAILTFEHKRPVIKSFSINGDINFHKRIPKAHYREDNIIMNNQTDFIPLPETKCRHPLFGPDYKKAIKVARSVKARLEEAVTESVVVKKEKKKKKKKDVDEMDMGQDVVDGGLNENSVEESSRKRRKSVVADESDQPVPKKKKKRVKQELSSETWDSEKAIEENLFNY